MLTFYHMAQLPSGSASPGRSCGQPSGRHPRRRACRRFFNAAPPAWVFRVGVRTLCGPQQCCPARVGLSLRILRRRWPTVRGHDGDVLDRHVRHRPSAARCCCYATLKGRTSVMASVAGSAGVATYKGPVKGDAKGFAQGFAQASGSRSDVSGRRCPGQQLASSRRLHRGRLSKAIRPIPHVGIVSNRPPARFNEGDGGGAGESNAAMLEDRF